MLPTVEWEVELSLLKSALPATSGLSTHSPRPLVKTWGLLIQAPDWVGRGDGGCRREGGGAQRYLVALPGCSIQSTWHYPWKEGAGIQLSPPQAELWDIPQGRKGGSVRELVRFWGEILADKSGLAEVAIRPALHSGTHC